VKPGTLGVPLLPHRPSRLDIFTPREARREYERTPRGGRND
jgi:hypothetical protein